MYTRTCFWQGIWQKKINHIHSSHTHTQTHTHTLTRMHSKCKCNLPIPNARKQGAHEIELHLTRNGVISQLRMCTHTHSTDIKCETWGSLTNISWPSTPTTLWGNFICIALCCNVLQRITICWRMCDPNPCIHLVCGPLAPLENNAKHCKTLQHSATHSTQCNNFNTHHTYLHPVDLFNHF